MDKKGFTMVEIMFSVVIIAIVMAFLVTLLIDINYDKTNELYDTANNFNRTEIIKTIEADFKDSYLYKYTNSSNVIKLYSDVTNYSTITIDVSNKYIKYKSLAGTSYKWEIKTNNSETHIYNEVTYNCYKNSNNNYLIVINIPIIVDNSNEPIKSGSSSELLFRDSKMDDITLTFYSKDYKGGC